MLAKGLREARKRVQELEEKLLEMEVREEGASPKSKKPIRIWMDGCFDMMHYGHMNAFRQGKALGTYLVVGVNSDETITGNVIHCVRPRASPCNVGHRYLFLSLIYQLRPPLHSCIASLSTSFTLT